ncbi:MAG: DUF1667 domain-containing protein [Erysipelotrichaceae bacterium]|nr:DUF1667 domain-containing protein [Erysipelotrichaceae bacterium]
MNLICINCPKGCRLTVNQVGEKIVVEGNSCSRGETYAINELTNPLRTVTTTLEIESKLYHRLPVITSSPIPKAKMMELMKILKDVKVKVPIKMGDVIVKNILDMNVDLIASKSINE